MRTLDLNGRWSFRRVESTGPASEAGQDKGAEWLEARVPGCVHLDLMRAERIPEPFYGTNEQQVQWVGRADWLYRRTFDCPADVRERRRVELVCDGLDTVAEVHLNGERLGSGDNMFVRHRWTVTDRLQPENNELLVRFESAEAVGRRRLEADKKHLRASEEPGRSYVRKAQYAGGWDWGPTLNSCGIWRPVRLEAWNRARMSDVWHRVDWEDPGRPIVRVTCELDAAEAGSAEVVAQMDGPDCSSSAEAATELTPGTNRVELSLPVENPRLWWPAGLGEPNLYDLSVSASAGQEELKPVQRSIGLRRVELRREGDQEGESFVLHVNGEPIFCRGANWIPADSLLPRLTADDYEKPIRQAVDANMNMLRVWGGGIYGSRAFYEACDRLGVMVWQDFMFACAAYPDHIERFRESVREEARQVVRRLRNHPSLVLWCGNNECQQLASTPEGLPGEVLFERILPEVCADLDPDRPYWPGSPWGGEEPNDPTHGDQHYWGPWWGWRHPDTQKSFPGRFLSEFGFQAPPTLETVRRYIPSSAHHMQSRTMEYHNKARDGTERLYRLLTSYFRVPCSFEDTVYLMQLFQGEAVKSGVEFWRSRKFRTAGALFWQLNDCWPVTSWSCIDYGKRPKALYYYARRFYSPVLPVIDRTDEGGFRLTLVNDRKAEFAGELVYGYARLNGDPKLVEREDLRIPANGVAGGPSIGPNELKAEDPAQEYFWCRVLENGGEIARDAKFAVPFKHVEFHQPEWEVQVEPAGRCRFDLTLTNWCFAKGVWLRLEGMEAEFSDNFFDLFPELPTTVRVTTEQDAEPAELHRRLRLRSLAETRS